MSVKPNTDDPLYRAKIELICLGRTLMPDDESFERTVATLVLFGVWATIVIGPMFFPEAEPPRGELQISITAVAFLVLGRMWDLEIERVLDGVTISTDGGQPRDRDRED
ncbi:hypothetical protein [Natronobacterium gregoryi]|uniref:Uncharacterized protein n=2 Tax=Natronobacterium gregoryi TaxID=44930 RepID=L0AGK2_NATGS|nr:hypothetical protein [Natronobacterium gregoryi]AFZ73028.1 hypothetical protein Natgr_1843 [Natronobacterium gregoryi SP2]ELY70709.1 hypothetical protein C490_06224 [Natronobacterium gregoryi SP2]PLK20445.1 hypothetical protein CYV19_09970 [Natronobacterium gregoryi SP2]SFI63271.1 hypothetical protein SAMN05443661_102238 [Natronobacterium gregoryi]